MEEIIECPNTRTCNVYEFWKRETKSNQNYDIIRKKTREKYHTCLALNYLKSKSKMKIENSQQCLLKVLDKLDCIE